MKNLDNFAAAELITLFERCFAAPYHTILSGGAEEPLYHPSTRPGDYHQVIFRADYFASALHETAHWCLAGAVRRQQLDYGYWYEGGSRSPAAQQRFQQVEARPQGLEWILSTAAGFPFRVSNDNLDLTDSDDVFHQAVQGAAIRFVNQGLPERAARFAAALHQHFRPDVDYLATEVYQTLPA